MGGVWMAAGGIGWDIEKRNWSVAVNERLNSSWSLAMVLDDNTNYMCNAVGRYRRIGCRALFSRPLTQRGQPCMLSGLSVGPRLYLPVAGVPVPVAGVAGVRAARPSLSITLRVTSSLSDSLMTMLACCEAFLSTI